MDVDVLTKADMPPPDAECADCDCQQCRWVNQSAYDLYKDLFQMHSDEYIKRQTIKLLSLMLDIDIEKDLAECEQNNTNHGMP